MSRIGKKPIPIPKDVKVDFKGDLLTVKAFDYVIVNHDDRLEHTVDVVRAIIEAEHHRVRQRKVSL